MHQVKMPVSNKYGILAIVQYCFKPGGHLTVIGCKGGVHRALYKILLVTETFQHHIPKLCQYVTTLQSTLIKSGTGYLIPTNRKTFPCISILYRRYVCV